MAAKRTIALLGAPYVNEDGSASEAITPGMLVKGVTSIEKHATAGGAHSRTFALERDELGNDIDEDYAIGDTVKVGSFTPGQRVLAFIASGQNITADGKLESAGNGTLRALASGVAIARALETLNVTELTRIRVEIV
jgi:hypothetical protein